MNYCRSLTKTIPTAPAAPHPGTATSAPTDLLLVCVSWELSPSSCWPSMPCNMSSLLPHSLSHSRCGVSARPCSALAFARPREGPAHPGHGLLAGTIPCWKPHRLLLSPCRIFLPADHTPGLEFGAGKPRARRGAVRWARLNSKGGFQGTETAARSGFSIVFPPPPSLLKA